MGGFSNDVITIYAPVIWGSPMSRVPGPTLPPTVYSPASISLHINHRCIGNFMYTSYTGRGGGGGYYRRVHNVTLPP